MKLALKKLVVAVSAAAGVMLGPATARAATITYAFTGTATNVWSPLGGTFAAGDALTGTFVIDTDAMGSSCGTVCAFYLSPAQVFSATLGSYGFSGVGLEAIIDQGSFTDSWAFGAGPYGTSVSGPAVNGHALSVFSLSLDDKSGTALSGLSLVPPVFSNYQTATFTLAFRVPGGFPHDEVSVYGTISSVSLLEPTPPTPPAVPEPASLGLLATGLLGLAVRRRASSRPRR